MEERKAATMQMSQKGYILSKISKNRKKTQQLNTKLLTSAQERLCTVTNDYEEARC